MVTSKSHVQDAIKRLTEIENEIEQIEAIIADRVDPELVKMEALSVETQELKAAVNTFVLNRGLKMELPTVTITRVQAFKRRWNVETLEKIVPRGIFKNLVKIEVDPAKVDEYVKKGKLDPKKIEAAYEETPNQPFVKWTPKAETHSAEAEAASLAAKLGA